MSAKVIGAGFGVLVLSSAVALGAAALGWFGLGRLMAWPPSPEHEALVLGGMAGVLVLWSLLLWATVRWLAARRQRTLARHAQVAELTQQPALTLDGLGKVDWVNAAFGQRTDRHGPHAIGRELAQALGLPEGEARTELEQAVAHGQALALTCTGADLHGNPLTWQVEMQPLRDAKARWLGATVLAMDGSAQVEAAAKLEALQTEEAQARQSLLASLEAERTLANSERSAWTLERERWNAEQDAMAHARAEAEAHGDRLHDELNTLHEGLEAAQTGTWQVDLGTHRVALDTGAMRLVGAASSVLLSRPVAHWADWLSADDWAMARAQFAPLLAGTATHRDAVVRLRAPGSEEGQALWIKAAVVAYGADGQAERIAGTVQRVGDAVQGLQQAWQLLRDGEALHGAAVFRLDEGSLILQASPQFFHLLGRPAQGGEMGWGQFAHQVADDVHRHALQNALDDALAEDAKGWDLTLPLRTALGAPLWVQCRAEPRVQPTGERAWLGVLQAVPEPARIDVAAPDPEPELDLVPEAPPRDPLDGRSAAQARFGAGLARTGRLLAPMLLNLPTQVRQASGASDRAAAAQRVALLARSLGAGALADALQAWDASETELPEALKAEIDAVVDAFQAA